MEQRPDVGAAGAHPVQHERPNPIWMLRRHCGRQLTTLRGTEQAKPISPYRIGNRQRRGQLPVERQVDPVPVGQAAPGLVIADHGKPLGQPVDEAAEGEQLQLPRRWVTQPVSHNNGGPAPAVE